MPGYDVRNAQTHDILQIHTESFLNEIAARGDCIPGWVEASVCALPFVVIRRGSIGEDSLPIGVRGTHRNQRYGTFCSSASVRQAITPAQLLNCSSPAARLEAIPALTTLALLKDRWMSVGLLWGPGGSVGFELATGRNVTSVSSDLDIVIRAPQYVSIEEARWLYAQTTDFPAEIDLRAETRVGGFSLKEYARDERKKILLRTACGAILTCDPWQENFVTSEGAQL